MGAEEGVDVLNFEVAVVKPGIYMYVRSTLVSSVSDRLKRGGIICKTALLSLPFLVPVRPICILVATYQIQKNTGAQSSGVLFTEDLVMKMLGLWLIITTLRSLRFRSR